VYQGASISRFLAAAEEVDGQKSGIKQTFIRGFPWTGGGRFGPAIPVGTVKSLN
jgi:hypothetical protein